MWHGSSTVSMPYLLVSTNYIPSWSSPVTKGADINGSSPPRSHTCSNFIWLCIVNLPGSRDVVRNSLLSSYSHSNRAIRTAAVLRRTGPATATVTGPKVNNQWHSALTHVQSAYTNFWTVRLKTASKKFVGGHRNISSLVLVRNKLFLAISFLAEILNLFTVPVIFSLSINTGVLDWINRSICHYFNFMPYRIVPIISRKC